MQSFLPHVSPEFYVLVGTLLGLIPQFISSYRNWKKSGLDDREAHARTQLAEASAASLRVRDEVATGEGVGKMLTTLIDAGDTIRELQVKVFDLEQDKIELVMRREEVRRMKALLVLNNIPYSDADKFRMKPE